MKKLFGMTLVLAITLIMSLTSSFAANDPTPELKVQQWAPTIELNATVFQVNTDLGFVAVEKINTFVGYQVIFEAIPQIFKDKDIKSKGPLNYEQTLSLYISKKGESLFYQASNISPKAKKSIYLPKNYVKSC